MICLIFFILQLDIDIREDLFGHVRQEPDFVLSWAYAADLSHQGWILPRHEELHALETSLCLLLPVVTLQEVYDGNVVDVSTAAGSDDVGVKGLGHLGKHHFLDVETSEVAGDISEVCFRRDGLMECIIDTGRVRGK